MCNKIKNKGLKMALPFIAGAAVGILSVTAFNKRDEILNYLKNGIKKSKNITDISIKRGKNLAKTALNSKPNESKGAKSKTNITQTA